MLPLNNVLNKVLVVRFYERNLGVFFFIFYLMFGIVESTQIVTYHLSLIYAMMDSLMFLLLVFVIWLLYMARCLQFITNQLDQPENNFLYQLCLLEPDKQLLILLGTVALVYLPVLAYSIVIMGVAFRSGYYVFVVEVVSYHFALLVLTAWFVKLKLNYPHKKSALLTLSFPRWKGAKPYVFFYLQQLSHQLPSALFITKSFSVLVLYGFLQIPLDHYEVRVAILGLLFGLAAHAVIIFELRKYEDRFLEFVRALPLTLRSRYAQLAIVYALLLLPEMILMAVHYLHFVDILPVWLFGCGFLIYLHCYLYHELNMDKLTQRILMLFLISFMLVLSKAYLVELLFLWGYSFYQFSHNYYRYEGLKGETIL